MMRRANKKFEPTVPASIIRARYRWVKKTLVVLLSLLAFGWLLGKLTQPDEAIAFTAIPLIVSYVLFCHAFGKLANCFGESTTSWTFTVLFLSFYGVALGYFAFKDGVLEAHSENS